MKHINTFVLLAAGLGLLCGCTSPVFEGTIFEYQPRENQQAAWLARENAREAAQPASAAQPDSLDIMRFSEQLNTIMRQQELLEERLNRIEAQGHSAAPGQAELSALRQDIQLLRSERDSLRSEITSDLAGRIESIADRQQAQINAAKAAAAPLAGQTGYEHKVEPGQTLSEISRGYGKSIDAIMKANKISNPSQIRAGQMLFIPD